MFRLHNQVFYEATQVSKCTFKIKEQDCMLNLHLFLVGPLLQAARLNLEYPKPYLNNEISLKSQNNKTFGPCSPIGPRGPERPGTPCLDCSSYIKIVQ